jgi:hypothetical protein
VELLVPVMEETLWPPSSGFIRVEGFPLTPAIPTKPVPKTVRKEIAKAEVKTSLANPSMSAEPVILSLLQEGSVWPSTNTPM